MIAARLLAPLACVTLAACTTNVPRAPGPRDIAPPADYAAQYRPPPGSGEAWWTGFEDPRLDALVERALALNLDLAATRDRLAAARALLRAERSDLVPRVDGQGSAVVVADTGDSRSAASAGLAGVFNPDISGRLSAEVQAAAAQAAAAEYFVADTRRVVAAEVARQYIELRRTGERLKLLDESTELQERTLRTVTLRFEAGLSANLDVRRAAADLSQTRAQRGLLDLQRAQASHALAVLTGQVPGAPEPLSDATLPDRSRLDGPLSDEPLSRGVLSGEALSDSDEGVPGFAGGPPRGTPADLLRRRPDILVAEMDLVEAAAIVGIERADLLPSLVITSQALAGDGSIGGIVSDFLIDVGASLGLPLFDGGRRRAEIAAAEAELDARFAQYRQQVLVAMSEVENALVAIQAFSDRGADLTQAIEESGRAFEQSDALYREGLTTLFDVLDSQRQLIDSRESLIDSEAALASAVVALYAAVGAPTGTGEGVPPPVASDAPLIDGARNSWPG